VNTLFHFFGVSDYEPYYWFLEAISIFSITIANVYFIDYFFRQKGNQKRYFPLYKTILGIILILSALVHALIIQPLSLIYQIDFIFVVLFILIIGIRHRVSKEQFPFWSLILVFILFISRAIGEIISTTYGGQLLHIFVQSNKPSSYLVSAILYSFKPVATILISFLTINGVKKIVKPNFQTTKKQSLPVTIALTTAGITSILLLIYFVRDLSISLFFKISRFHILAIAAIIILNVSIMVIYKGMEKNFEQLNRLSIEKKEFEMQTKQLQLLKDSQDKINSLKHDLKNEHIVLLGMLKDGEHLQAQDYLKNYLKQIEDTDKFYTNNAILNFLLNEKNKEAKEKNVLLHADVLYPNKTKLDNEIMAVVIGNLLDNAISAVSRYEGKKDLYLTIKSFNQNIKIELANSFDLTELESRKHRQKDGLGIKNIKRIVENNGGIYKQWVDGEVYYTSILFLNLFGDEDL
jgi:Ca2+/Na+ antiporter